MVSTADVLDRIHRSLARSNVAVRALLLLRNQVQCVLKYHLGGIANSDVNGEQLVVDTLAPYVQTFADVGANVGNWSEMLVAKAPKSVKGLLFEPSDSAFARLSANPLLTRSCELFQAAVSDSAGSRDFFEEPGAGETSSLMSSASRSTAVTRQISCVTLADVLADRKWETLDFLKVDVEGFDLHVLRGAGDYLKAGRIGVIQFEYNNVWAHAGSTLFAALQLLRQSGYDVFLIRADGISRFDYASYGEFFTYSNFLAVSPGWASRIDPLMGRALLQRRPRSP